MELGDKKKEVLNKSKRKQINNEKEKEIKPDKALMPWKQVLEKEVLPCEL